MRGSDVHDRPLVASAVEWHEASTAPRSTRPVAPAMPPGQLFSMPHTLTLAIAQLKPAKADYPANLARLRALFRQIEELEPRPDVLHLPETALTGYFLEGGVREVAITAGTLAADVGAEWAAAGAERGAGGGRRPLDLVIGFYEIWRNTLHNSAMYLRLSDDGAPAILHVHRKNFLPTYGLFDEERFVERGTELQAFDTPWGRAGILVCEDAWHSLTGTVLALDGAQMVFICAAAPARGVWPRDDAVPGPASVARWDRLSRDIAEEHAVFVSLANLVGSEGGKMFGGTSLLCGPGGDVRLRGAAFDEQLILATIALPDLTRARADAPLLSDLRNHLPHLRVALDGATGAAHGGPGRAPVEWDGAESEVPGERILVHPEPAASAAAADTAPQAIEALAVVRGTHGGRGAPPPLEIDAELVTEWLCRFIRDEMRGRGYEHAIVGLSGGVDSAVTTYLAARALGPEHVIAVRMPYRTSSAESLDHAQLVIDDLGLEARTVDISAAVDGYLAAEPDANGARRGNVMARTRMIALFDLSARYAALPLGTGNKTERLFGYFTWHADDSPPINPLGDLFKTQVWALARHLGVPDDIVDKPASADLVEGQTDEGDFGISYARADIILNWLLFGHTPRELAERGFDPAEVEIVRRRLDGTHWKRRPPTVAMLTATAIGESYLRPVDY